MDSFSLAALCSKSVFFSGRKGCFVLFSLSWRVLVQRARCSCPCRGALRGAGMTRDCPMAPLSCPSPHSSTSWEKSERCPQSPASRPGSPTPFLSPPTWIRLLILREGIPWSTVCAVLWGWGRLGLGSSPAAPPWDHGGHPGPLGCGHCSALVPVPRRWQQSVKSSGLASNLQPSGAKADALREEMEEAANRVEICRVPGPLLAEGGLGAPRLWGELQPLLSPCSASSLSPACAEPSPAPQIQRGGIG